MKIELIRIGNSRGIRIPKPVIEQCGFGDRIELLVEQGRLIIAPDRSPRRDWKEAFAGASKQDPLLLEPFDPNEFDAREWAW